MNDLETTGNETDLYGGDRGRYFNLNPEALREPPKWLLGLLIEPGATIAGGVRRLFCKYQNVFMAKIKPFMGDDILRIQFEDEERSHAISFCPECCTLTHHPTPTFSAALSYDMFVNILLNREDCFSGFRSGNIRFEGNTLLALKLKHIFEAFQQEEFVKYKLQKIEAWRWQVLSGFIFSYVDRHGDVLVTERVGRIGSRDSREQTSFELGSDEVITCIKGDVLKNKSMCGTECITKIYLETNQGRSWSYGGGRGGEEFCCRATKPNTFFHYFRGRAGDSIIAIGFGLATGAEEGRPYFRMWTPANHTKFSKDDREKIELVFLSAVLMKGSFGGINDGRSGLSADILWAIFSYY